MLAPLPTLISRRFTDDSDASSPLKEACAFLTTGIVLSAFALPIVLARAPASGPTVSFSLYHKLPHCLLSSLPISRITRSFSFRLNGEQQVWSWPAMLSFSLLFWASSSLLTTRMGSTTARGDLPHNTKYNFWKHKTTRLLSLWYCMVIVFDDNSNAYYNWTPVCRDVVEPTFFEFEFFRVL